MRLHKKHSLFSISSKLSHFLSCVNHCLQVLTESFTTCYSPSVSSARLYPGNATKNPLTGILTPQSEDSLFSIILLRFIILYILCFFACKECLCFFYNHTAQCKQCDHIRNCHQSVEDICDSPYCTYGHVRSDKYCKNVKPAICKDCFFMSMCQIFQASFTVVIPSKDCRECEEYQTDH